MALQMRNQSDEAGKSQRRHQLPIKFVISNRTPLEPESEEEEEEEEEEEKQEEGPPSNSSDIKPPFSNPFSSPFSSPPSFNYTTQEAKSSASSNSVSIFDTFSEKSPFRNKETFGKH